MNLEQCATTNLKRLSRRVAERENLVSTKASVFPYSQATIPKPG
jgi:hypothetical protein